MGLGPGREVCMRPSLSCCSGVVLAGDSCSLPPSPAVYFQVSGASATPEKLLNLLACSMSGV